jgi:hypothetical protein
VTEGEVGPVGDQWHFDPPSYLRPSVAYAEADLAILTATAPET